ncbi:putative holin-like toxin [Bacillus sp. FSL W7-1360]
MSVYEALSLAIATNVLLLTLLTFVVVLTKRDKK